VTDEEEMARQYLIEKYGLRKDLEIERIQHTPLCIEFYTYLEGLKAGEKLGLEKGLKAKVNMTTISDCPIKPVWHKVADGDLPPADERFGASIDVLTDSGCIAYCLYEVHRWYDMRSYAISTPKAWCEIPKYTEE